MCAYTIRINEYWRVKNEEWELHFFSKKCIVESEGVGIVQMREARLICNSDKSA